MRVCGLETLEKDEPVLWAQPAPYKGPSSGQLQSGPFIKKNLEIYQQFLAVDVYVNSIQILKKIFLRDLKALGYITCMDWKCQIKFLLLAEPVKYLQIADQYAFIPREAISRFLTFCSECQRKQPSQQAGGKKSGNQVITEQQLDSARGKADLSGPLTSHLVMFRCSSRLSRTTGSPGDTPSHAP